MESPFDIAADLDTPVSAYMKLGPFKPRFLLESVESGERLARYSFIGLGEALTLEFYPDRLKIDGKTEKRPASVAEWLALMRGALERAPLLKPQIEDIPFDGGLVGTTGYDVVRFFERLPPNRAELDGLPQAVYVAPESLLVFDHLTRRVALLHSGSERDRQALRTSVVNALRGGLDAPQRGSKFGAADASMTQEEHSAAVQKGKAHIKAGDIYRGENVENFLDSNAALLPAVSPNDVVCRTVDLSNHTIDFVLDFRPQPLACNGRGEAQFTRQSLNRVQSNQ